MSTAGDYIGESLGWDSLTTVRLEDLPAESALLHRVDRKYLIARHQLPELIGAAPESTHRVTVAGRDSLRYESIYYDSEGLTSFHDAAWGRPRRYKIRRRTYLDSGDSWLELKVRDTRGFTHKTRSLLEGSTADQSYNWTLLAEELGHWGIQPERRYWPTLSTQYERSTLYLAQEGCRVTVDRGVNWHRLGAPVHSHGATANPGDTRIHDDDWGGSMPVAHLSKVIVETKTAGAASSFDRMLWAHGIRPVSFSKYAVGLARMDEHLPHNRWYRVMRLLEVDGSA